MILCVLGNTPDCKAIVMNSSKYFDISLNDEQQQAFEKIKRFFQNNDQRVFILKGHAGTGKTTLVKGLIKYLKDQEIKSVLLASTGRAAKILREKASVPASTVHKHIYDFENDELDDKIKIRKLSFRLIKNLDKDNAVYFVDESSIISNQKVKATFLNFGTGMLLTDLLYFCGKRKIVFVGDPAQLPPVNCKFSAALNEVYFNKKFNIRPQSTNLTQIVRFSQNSGIYHNTNHFRNSIQSSTFPMLSVKASNFGDIQVHHNLQEMVRHYVERIRATGVENCIFINLSNKENTYVNNLTRSYLYSKRKAMQFNKNESLMVVRNNYLHDLLNGDQVLVRSVSPKTEYRAGLRFREAELMHVSESGGNVINAKIIENLLGMNTSDLDQEQEYKLFLDFVIRMRKIGLRSKDQKFKEMMMEDPYLNALRVKYGYAITCHKAQGGEWQEVFIQFERSMFFFPKENIYRWAYTAISRSTEKLHLLDNRCIY